ncbi:MAG: DEAD/DEAH box helicase [Proteobacteria bacterium]|nr:DEAD/DEAH box helicase [Pseudomonadota bacterium]MBU1449423.1 DEAD/DEAH box helicase [Pseudomonadota bacterium]MBU2470565.1 DEAD/DEAH box helicase [Pseudomonadota bacterium]MBU2516255.1 DEAD/DEAH box helicase [Pseudomonadota bacterium]
MSDSPLNSFDQLALCAPLQRALRSLGYQTPTPVQAAAIPPLLEGRDLLGCSQTGTGKTAAFALPILQKLSLSKQRPAPRNTRTLVLTPTRELAVQVASSFQDYGRYLGLKMAVVYGGVSLGPQIRACSRGLDVVVATPGRLMDLMARGHLLLGNLDTFVLDEADRMLDMGFLPDIKRILSLIPKRRQSLFFSATMPSAIAKLADSILTDPVRVQVAPAATPVDLIDQRVLFVTQNDKRALLGEVLKDSQTERVLVFTRTKHAADRVVQQLVRSQVNAEAIHGNKSQNARQNALTNFRNGRTRVLVATDIASRGIDVEGITHVINYDLPHEPESYVHRIGRTGRAGSDGVAISFCAPQEKICLRNIERLIRQAVPVQDSRSYGVAGSRPPQNLAARRPPRHNRRPSLAA